MRALAWALCLTAPALAQEPTTRPTPAPSEAPAEPPAAPDPVPELVAPTPALARQLARLRQRDEPQRQLARAFVSVIQGLLEGDAERLVPWFHPDHQQHAGGGKLEPLPPRVLRQNLAQRGPDSGPGLAVEAVLDVVSVRVYTRKRALAVDPAKEGWSVELGRLGKLMQPDDWLVIGRTKPSRWEGGEAFFVFRRDPSDPHRRFKVVLSD